MIFIPFVGPGVAPLDPSSIADLSAWFDPDDSATLTVDGSGDVTLLEDKAGSADITDISGQPKPSTTTYFGRTWLNFDAIHQEVLHVADPLQSEVNFGSGELTIAVVVRTTATTTNKVVLNKGATHVYRVACNFTSTSIGDPYAIENDGSTVHTISGEGSSALNDGNPHLLVLMRDNSSNQMRLYMDGAQVDGSPQDITGLGSLDDASFELIIGAVPFAGSSYNRWWDGGIGEIVMVKRALSSSELAGLRAHFQQKWGAA